MASPLRERWINELGFCRVIKVWKSLRSADFNTEGKDLSCCWLEELCLFQSGWAVVTSICLPFFNLQAGEKPNAPPLSYHMSLNMLIAKWINAHHLQPCLGGFWDRVSSRRGTPIAALMSPANAKVSNRETVGMHGQICGRCRHRAQRE